MKSPYFTEAHELFRQSVAKFMTEEVAPKADLWEKDRMIPREIWRRMGELGYLGITFPEKWGGTDCDLFYAIAFMEELARSNMGGFAAAVGVQQFMATAHLARVGSDLLKARYLAASIEGDRIGALAISEPDCGSDVSALTTRAERKDDHFLLNGSKNFITNGYYADFIVVAARTGEAGSGGISLLIVDTNSTGFRARKLDKMGWHCSDTAELSFENVVVPISNLIGQENKGFYYIMESFQLERLVAAASSIGAIDCCIQHTLKYIATREAFHRKLAKFQVIRHELAELETELEAARQLVYLATWLQNQGEMAVRESSMAKLKATELLNRVTNSCLQFFGGYGYMDEYLVSRMYRDARVGTIAGGASAIMREIIAKILFDSADYHSAYQATTESTTPNDKPVQAPSGSGKIATLLEGLRSRFDGARAGAWRGLFHFKIGGPDGGDFSIEVAGGACTLQAGLHGQASCVLESNDRTLLELAAGKTSPEAAFMSQQIRVSDLGEMMSFLKAFPGGFKAPEDPGNERTQS